MAKDDQKLTPKQEAFALAFFETGSAVEAYRKAYDVGENAKDSWVYVEAYQLAEHPKIALYLSSLREQAKRLSIYTRQQALEEYEAARLLAMKPEVNNPSAAVSAVKGKVALIGLEAPAKSKIDHTSTDGSVERATAAASILIGKLDAIARRTASEPSEG